jgi:hypothetical protein
VPFALLFMASARQQKAAMARRSTQVHVGDCSMLILRGSPHAVARLQLCVSSVS